MNDILYQIEMSRAKAADMVGISQIGASNLLRMNADTMELLLAVAEAAKSLRDHSINYSGTPPARLVCDLDDELKNLQ